MQNDNTRNKTMCMTVGLPKTLAKRECEVQKEGEESEENRVKRGEREG